MVAAFAARVIWPQSSANTHSLLEIPAGNGLFELDCFKRSWATGNLVSINVPQCALGLIKQRLQRGDKRNQVVAQERSEHQPGDLVDIWYDLPNKDTPGWRGRAQIASVNLGEGNVAVRFQGSTLDRRLQEVRVHVPYLVYMLALIDSKAEEWIVVQKVVEN